MKNAMKLLEAIGQIQDAYIMDAHSDIPKHAFSRKRLFLIAAAAAAALLLAGCAAYAWLWFVYDLLFMVSLIIESKKARVKS